MDTDDTFQLTVNVQLVVPVFDQQQDQEALQEIQTFEGDPVVAKKQDDLDTAQPLIELRRDLFLDPNGYDPETVFSAWGEASSGADLSQMHGTIYFQGGGFAFVPLAS